jgi:hypothetical protein
MEKEDKVEDEEEEIEIEGAAEEEEGEEDKMVVNEEVVEIEEITEIVIKMEKDKKKCTLTRQLEKHLAISRKCKNKFYKKKHVFFQ